MPNGHLDIGKGIGDASVWNSNPAAQNFANVLAQQKADQAAKDKALVDQMASIKTDGIRNADKEDYKNKYNDWAQTAKDANNLPMNSPDRLQKLADAQNKFQNINDFISESKKESAHENSLGNMLLSNRHMLSDDAHAKVMKSMQSAMSDSNFIPSNKYGDLERSVDPEKMAALLDKGKQKALEDTIPNRVQLPGVAKEGDATGVYIQNQKNVPYQKVAENYLNLASHNSDFKKYLDDSYPTVKSDTDLGTTAARVHQLMAERGELNGWSHSDNSQFKANDDSFEKHKRNRDYDNAHPTPGTVQANGLTPTQSFGSDILNGNSDRANSLLSLSRAKFRPGEKPTFAKNADGTQTITLPDQVTPVAKYNEITKNNKEAEDDYKKSPSESTGGFLGMGSTDIPWDKSDTKANLENPYKVQLSGRTVTLDPKNPIDHQAQLASIANEIHIPVDAINKWVGGKGSKGVNTGITNAQQHSPTKTSKSSSGITWK